MVWILCLSLSLLVLAAAIVSAVLIATRKYKRGRMLTPYNVVFVGVCVSIFISLLPIYRTTLEGTSQGVLKTVLFALHNTFQVITLDADRSVITDVLSCSDPLFGSVYSVFLSAAYVCAPILTFGFLASLFKNFSAMCRYILHFRSEVYAFSELNEKALALAADLRRNHPHAAIVFADASYGKDDASSERLEQAQELRSLCIKKDIFSVNLSMHSPRAPLVLFVIGDDETRNTEPALKLISRYRNRKNTKLVVFSKSVDSELLLRKADKGSMEVRRINDNRSLITRLLYEQGTELFTSARDGEDGKKKICAVLVGLGRFGAEMLKALSWFGQMDGYTLEIHAFDLDPKAEERFAALAPELLSKDYNGCHKPGEAEYTILIHSGVDIETKSFYDAIMALKDTTYVFVALGSDRVNLQTAVNLRMTYERMQIHPVVQAVIFDSELNQSLEDISSFNGQPYDIRFIGDINTSYSEGAILNASLEAEALQRHMRWGAADEFWDEYNFNSSIASNLHLKVRAACGQAFDGDDPAQVEKGACLEHRRWNAYMRSEGYVYNGSISKRNDLAKMHPDLVPYQSLAEEEKDKDRRIVRQQ